MGWHSLVHFPLVVAVALAMHSVGSAAEITGTVSEVSGSTATIETSDRTPVVGAKVDIFFKLAGADDEISVADGTVVSKEGNSIKVKIENATGEVAKDQLARFTGASEPAVTRATPPPQETPLPEETTPKSTPTQTLPPSVPMPPQTAATTRPPTVDPAAVALVAQANTQYAAGNIAGAIESYTDALRKAPGEGVVYLNRGNAYLYKPDFRAALADANKAIELKASPLEDAYTVRGTAKAGLGDYDGGIADCNRALKINPKAWLAYNNRANNKLRKRDYAGALADGTKALALNPNSAIGYYNRGFARTNLGDQAGALADWQKAVAIQASFGAELNPKIAQLQALGIRPQQKDAGRKASPAAPESEWTDLTNAPRKLVGSWKGGRHVTQYLADGSFYTDPHLVPNPPRGRWRIEGDRLIQTFPQANTTTTHNILSITANELVLRSARGETFRFRRGTE